MPKSRRRLCLEKEQGEQHGNDKANDVQGTLDDIIVGESSWSDHGLCRRVHNGEHYSLGHYNDDEQR